MQRYHTKAYHVLINCNGPMKHPARHSPRNKKIPKSRKIGNDHASKIGSFKDDNFGQPGNKETTYFPPKNTSSHLIRREIGAATRRPILEKSVRPKCALNHRREGLKRTRVLKIPLHNVNKTPLS